MKPRVCAVSYLNTAPLVWGVLHGSQRNAFDLRFEIPSRCADLLRSGEVDIGLVPVVELDRQPLEMIPGLGIASHGAVRSILLISRVPLTEIATLAADASSRTSVVLARILLSEKYGVRPSITEASPDVPAMLDGNDACLIIGDPALRFNSLASDLHVVDLGAEWSDWSGLPMVYAVWAGRAGSDWSGAAKVLEESWLFGRDRIHEIALREHSHRGLSLKTAEEYLTRNIHFELTGDYLRGLELYRELARSHGPA